jgi:hypothetical protein
MPNELTKEDLAQAVADAVKAHGKSEAGKILDPDTGQQVEVPAGSPAPYKPVGMKPQRAAWPLALMMDTPEVLDIPLNEVKWKVQSTYTKADGTPMCIMVCYFDARAGRRVLNKVFDPLGWKQRYRTERIMVTDTDQYGKMRSQYETTLLICTISLWTGTAWLDREDGGEPSFGTEPGKGGISNAFKRACGAVGIGDNLYELPKLHVEGVQKGSKIVTKLKYEALDAHLASLLKAKGYEVNANDVQSDTTDDETAAEAAEAEAAEAVERMKRQQTNQAKQDAMSMAKGDKDLAVTVYTGTIELVGAHDGSDDWLPGFRAVAAPMADKALREAEEAAAAAAVKAAADKAHEIDAA